MHEYSTTEKVVGTWIDGRPIYEKTYFFQPMIFITSSLVELADVSDLNICGLIQGRGGLVSAQNDYWAWCLMLRVKNSKLYAQCPQPSGSFGTDYIIIQYIKTTDTPTVQS